MLSQNTIKELSIKNQIREDNIVREYIQHLFLSAFYSQKGSDAILFKGGTALRIIFHSPRFSEDLDFSVQKVLTKNVLDDFFLKSIFQIENQGITIELKEAKLITGGYLGILSYSLYGYKGEINIEIILDKNLKSGYFSMSYFLTNPNSKIDTYAFGYSDKGYFKYSYSASCQFSVSISY